MDPKTLQLCGNCTILETVYKRAQIKQLGGDDYGELVTIDIPQAGRLTLLYMSDPEGNIVELQKWHDA